jgi:membrane protease subunit (stomatin/prohibitin family)
VNCQLQEGHVPHATALGDGQDSARQRAALESQQQQQGQQHQEQQQQQQHQAPPVKRVGFCLDESAGAAAAEPGRQANFTGMSRRKQEQLQREEE